MERTLMMIKPDGVDRGLIGEIICRIEKKGLKIKALEMQFLTRERAENLYSIHQGKHFFNDLVRFITRGPIVAMVIEGKDAISMIRKLMGSTNPLDADLGSIRGDFAYDFTENLVHGSDSIESAEREIPVLFP